MNSKREKPKAGKCGNKRRQSWSQSRAVIGVRPRVKKKESRRGDLSAWKEVEMGKVKDMILKHQNGNVEWDNDSKGRFCCNRRKERRLRMCEEAGRNPVEWV